jgi:hypothetical protein
MKLRFSLAVCTASLFIALPVFAQGKSDQPHGNNSDHSGHDNDGKSAGHRQDRPHGFGSGTIVLSTPAQTAAVSNAVTSVTSALRSGSLTTSSGAVIPAAAQANTYAVMTADAAQSTSASQLSAALSTAGSAAGAIVPALVSGFSALRTTPAELPSVVATYNDFTKAASPSFIAKPPAEFLAMRAVLAQLTAAAASAK